MNKFDRVFVSCRATELPPQPPGIDGYIQVMSPDGVVREPVWMQNEKGDWWFPVAAGDTIVNTRAIPAPNATISAVIGSLYD